jgi:hypothetical protein
MEKEHLDLVAATLTAALLKPIDYAVGRGGDADERATTHAVALYEKVRAVLKAKAPSFASS